MDHNDAGDETPLHVERPGRSRRQAHGRHLSLRHAIVRFGATTVASYISRSDSKIRVRVPRGTAKGRVKVTVTTLICRSSPKSFLRL
jgi:hypothetical protein